MKYTKLIGLGHYLPKKIMTNFDFEKMVDTSDEWIRTRTGIRERHFTEEGETASTMAIEASKKALSNAGISKDDIDLIIVGTVTGDTRYPSTAALLQKGLEISKPIPAFDIQAACSGFVFGLAVADSMIKTGVYKNVLVVGTENLSKFTDMTDRNTCVLFGDGAGAAVLTASEEPGILSHYIATEGAFAQLIELPAGGSKMPASEETVRNRLHYTRMEGQEVYRQAVKDMSDAAIEALKRANLKLEDADWILPHQANIRIIEAVAKRLKADDKKVFSNLEYTGNTSAASIPIALSEMVEKGLLKKGQVVVLTALGSGLTFGSVVFKY